MIHVAVIEGRPTMVTETQVRAIQAVIAHSKVNPGEWDIHPWAKYSQIERELNLNLRPTHNILASLHCRGLVKFHTDGYTGWWSATPAGIQVIAKVGLKDSATA